MTTSDRAALELTDAETSAPHLARRYARELPELTLPWDAAHATAPRMLALNDPLAVELGIDPRYLQSEEGLRLLVGNEVPEGATPVAQAYAGHQFGGYSPRLGDGRALLLGEFDDGRDLHLKGSGRTPFSRGGDGLAGVAQMLREYVISEAMYALGVPTTRSLAVVGTGNTVYRESPLPGAVLARVAASHIRVGTFQFARASGDVDLLRRLVDHAIDRHHSRAAEAENPYLALFQSVLAAQASTIADWMAIGFIHGVMNTDNSTISGETIDYGPCAFMEAFDPATVFSSIDEQGRYAYGNQPGIMQWNLARFAETLIPLVHNDPDEAVRLLTESLATFTELFNAEWAARMYAKLGIGGEDEGTTKNDNDNDDDAASKLIEDLLAILGGTRVDYTEFFRHLTSAARGDDRALRELFAAAPSGFCSEADPGAEAGSDPGPVDAWLQRWRAWGPSAEKMARVNPVYIPRNHLVEEVLDAATAGDIGPLEELLVVVTRPYDERPGLERFAARAPVGAAPFVTYCGT